MQMNLNQLCHLSVENQFFDSFENLVAKIIFRMYNMLTGSEGMDFRKKYESLKFKDDFMFGVVMSDVNIAKRVISVILAEEIPDIESCELQKVVENGSSIHGVRYDVYIKTENGQKVYNVEMQTAKNDHLPKRSRYYQSTSDADFLKKGDKYRDLPESYVIFICEFDLFEKGKAIYKFENYCLEEGIPLSDKTYKFFLNTTGKTQRKELQILMTYIRDNIPGDSLTDDIQSKVDEVQHDGKLFSSYIKEQQNAMLLEEKGIKEGIEIGRAEGEAKGRADSIKQLLKKGLSAAYIIDLFDLSDDEAKKYFGNMQTV